MAWILRGKVGALWVIFTFIFGSAILTIYYCPLSLNITAAHATFIVYRLPVFRAIIFRSISCATIPSFSSFAGPTAPICLILRISTACSGGTQPPFFIIILFAISFSLLHLSQLESSHTFAFLSSTSLIAPFFSSRPHILLGIITFGDYPAPRHLSFSFLLRFLVFQRFCSWPLLFIVCIAWSLPIWSQVIWYRWDT